MRIELRQLAGLAGSKRSITGSASNLGGSLKDVTHSSSGLDVLAISHSAALYGAERCLLNLVQGLVPLNIRVRVLLPGQGPLVEKLEEVGAQTFTRLYRGWLRLERERMPFRSWLRMGLNAAAVRRLEWELRSDRPAIIYSNSLATPVGAMLAMRLGVPHVWHARESVKRQQRARYDPGDQRALRFISLSSSCVVCMSHAIREELAPHIDAERLTVIYDGLLDEKMQRRFAPRRLSWRPGERPLELVHAASIARSKGHPDAIRALAALKERGVDARLHIAGTGSAAQVGDLKELSQRLGVADRVIWEGFCDDVPGLIARCDVAMVCSPFEAFGRVAVEAMAAGTPLVTSAGGGLSEIVSDRLTGLVYPPGDPERLAENIIKLASDPHLYCRLSSRAFEEVYCRFSINRYAEDMARLFVSLKETRQYGGH